MISDSTAQSDVLEVFCLSSAALNSYNDCTLCFSSLPQRFIQYLASRTSLFNLSNFIDKTGSHGKNKNRALSADANGKQEETSAKRAIGNGNDHAHGIGHRLMHLYMHFYVLSDLFLLHIRLCWPHL